PESMKLVRRTAPHLIGSTSPSRMAHNGLRCTCSRRELLACGSYSSCSLKGTTFQGRTARRSFTSACHNRGGTLSDRDLGQTGGVWSGVGSSLLENIHQCVGGNVVSRIGRTGFGIPAVDPALVRTGLYVAVYASREAAGQM